MPNMRVTIAPCSSSPASYRPPPGTVHVGHIWHHSSAEYLTYKPAKAEKGFEKKTRQQILIFISYLEDYMICPHLFLILKGLIHEKNRYLCKYCTYSIRAAKGACERGSNKGKWQTNLSHKAKQQRHPVNFLRAQIQRARMLIIMQLSEMCQRTI